VSQSSKFLASISRPADILTTMAYIECPSCGKTALSVASRCPHCGLLFSQGVLPPVEPNRLPGRLLLAGAIVAFLALVVLARKQNEPRAAALSPAPPVTTPAATAPGERRTEPPAALVAPPVPVQPTAPARDSAVDSTPPPAVSVPVAAPPRAAPVPEVLAPAVPAGDQVRRYATTWVNVRDRRGPGAEPVRVLDPGEAILVDSLVGGWYRVVIDGQPIGYAYGSNLSAETP
jgi:hypothetical protein